MGYTVHNIRGQDRSSYEVNRIDSMTGRAIIKLRPKSKIEKNFTTGDTINSDFVKHYSFMDCYWFYSDSIFTHCLLDLKDSTYLIFKGDPGNNFSEPRWNIAQAQPIIGNWRYISSPKQ